MSKKFASSVGILVLVNLLVKFIWIFGVERGMQLQVGFQNYGLYYSLFNFTFILSIIGDGGLTNYLNGFTAQQKQQDTFLLKLILAGIYLISALSIGYLVGYPKSYFSLLFVLIIYQIFWSFLTYLRSFLKVNQLFKAETLFSVFDKMLLIVLFIPLLYGKIASEINIYFFAAMQVLAVFISIVVCSVILLKNKIYVFSIKRFNPKLSLIKEIAPFALFTFLVMAYNKIDSVMLEKMLTDGPQQSGIYAAAYRLLDASNIIPILFATLFLPVISQNIFQKTEITRLVKLSFETLISWSIILSLSCWFYRNELMLLLYQDKSSGYLALVFGVLMFSSPLIVLFYIFSTLLTAQKELNILNWVACCGLLLNVTLNLFLIPKHGALGAAIATLIAFIFIGLTYLYFYHQKLQSTFKTKQVLSLLGLLVMLYLTGFALNYLNINWIISLTFYLMLGVLYTFILKLVSVKSIINLLKQ